MEYEHVDKKRKINECEKTVEELNLLLEIPINKIVKKIGDKYLCIRETKTTVFPWLLPNQFFGLPGEGKMKYHIPLTDIIKKSKLNYVFSMTTYPDVPWNISLNTYVLCKSNSMNTKFQPPHIGEGFVEFGVQGMSMPYFDDTLHLVTGADVDKSYVLTTQEYVIVKTYDSASKAVTVYSY
jgi:hypothetical protein